MSATPEMLEQFVRESRARAEQLSNLLLDAAGPAGAAARQLAVELRDAASGAQLETLAELAASVERVCVAVADGALHWDPSLGGALVAAVDELASLAGSAASWSSEEDARARTFVRELSAYAPAPAKPHKAAAPSGDDTRPIVPIESLFYSDSKSPVEMAASLLDASISAMGALTGALGDLVANPLATGESPKSRESEIVPVEQLVYRGKAALDRAIEVRDELREAGGAPDPAALDELYDLIALARAG